MGPRATHAGSRISIPIDALALRLLPLLVLLHPVPVTSMDTFYFTDSPRHPNPVVVEGQLATLRCDVNNHHLIRVHWTLDGKEIADNPRR